MASSELQILITAQDRASGVLSGVNGALSSFGSNATRVGGMLTVGLTAPLAAVGTMAVNTAADYQTSMNILQAKTGATALEMRQLGETALRLGADMTLPATSAADAANAMMELARRGLSVRDTMDAVRGVLQLSASAQISNAEAARITANALNAFGLAGSEASRIADMLTAASMSSGVSVNDLGYALQMSSAVAKQAGVPIDQLVASISQMAQAGILGSDAGTSLKTMLLSLMAPTQQSAELMRQLGISVYDSSGQFLPLDNIVAQFSGTLGGMSEAQRNAALQTIFGTDAIRAANIVLLGGTERHAEMAAAVNQTGVANDLASARMTGFNGALAGLSSQIETTLLTAALPFLAMLEQMVRQLAEVVSGLANTDPQFQMMIVTLGAVVAAAGVVTLGLGLMATAVSALLSPLGLVVVAVTALAAAWATNFGGIRDITAAVVGGLQTAFEAVRTALLSQGEQINWLGAAWAQFQTLLSGIITQIQSIIQTLFSAIGTFLQAHASEIQTTLGDAWVRIGSIIQTAIAIIQAVVVPAFTEIANFIRAHGEDIQRILTAAWELIRGVITAALTVIQGVLRAALQAIQGDWSGAWETLRRTGESLWGIIRDTVVNVARQIGPMLAAVWAQVLAATIAAWDAVRQGIESRLQEALAAVVRWLDNTLLAIENFNLVDAAVTLFTTIIPGMLTALGQALIDFGKWEIRLFQRVTDVNLRSAAQTAFTTMIAGMLQALGDALSRLSEWLTKAAGVIASRSFESETLRMMQTFVSGVLRGAGMALDAVVNMMNDIIGAISGQDFSGIGAALIEGLRNGIMSAAASVAAAAAAVVRAAIDAARAALSAHSPSKVFEEIGLSIPQGLASGINMGIQLPIDAIKSIIEQLADLAGYFADPARGIGSAKAVTDPLGEIFKNLKDILDGLATLGEEELMPSLRRVRENLGAVMDGLRDLTSTIILRLKDLAGVMADPAMGIGSAKAVTDPLAEIFDNLQTIIDGIDALGAASLPAWATAGGKAPILGRIITAIIETLSSAARSVNSDMLMAARMLAEGIKPVMEVVGPAVDALNDLIDLPDSINEARVMASGQALVNIAQSLAVAFAKAAVALGEDLLAQAQVFAQGAQAVSAVTKAMGEAIEEVIKVVELLNSQEMDYFLFYNGAQWMADTLRDLATALVTGLSGAVVDLGVVPGFVARLREALALVSGVMGELQLIAGLEMNRAALAELGYAAGLSWLTALGDGVRAGVEAVRTVVREVAGIAREGGLSWVVGVADGIRGGFEGLRGALAALLAVWAESQLSPAAMMEMGFTVGSSWISGLTNGILAGIPALEAALAQVDALLPHSPAKEGPLKRPPNWDAYFGFGLPGALGNVRGMLGGMMPTGALSAGWGAGGGGRASAPVTVNINNPVVRDVADIQRLANAVAGVLTQQTSNERRLQAGWS